MTAHQNKNSASKTISNHDVIHKGQLILKCPFGVFKSPKKQKKKSRISALASKKRSNKK